MISWWFTHFLDSPERSLWIIPAGFFISWLVYGAKHGRKDFNRKSVVLGIVTTAALFGLWWSAIRYLPASIYSELAENHHQEWETIHNESWVIMGWIPGMNNNDNTRMMSGADIKTTYRFNFQGSTNYNAWKDSLLSFTPQAIIGWDGIKTIDDLQITHEKYIHLILVRNDGGDFLHLHPEQQSDWARSTSLNFPSAGKWTVYADINSKEFWPQIIKDSLTIEGNTTNFIVNPVQSTGVVITQSGIDFNITRDTPNIISANNFYVNINSGTLENYLWAKGHMVAINLSDMGYSHVHPNENKAADSLFNSNAGKWTSFMAHFERAGTYRIFIQVQIAGVIYTLPLSIEVPEEISWAGNIGEHGH